MESVSALTPKSDGDEDKKCSMALSVTELISILRTAYRTVDFDRVEEVLVDKESKLKSEIGMLSEKLEVERLERMNVEEQLKKFMDQFEKGKKAEERYEKLLLTVKKNSDLGDENTKTELRNKNRKLEDEKRRAESEMDSWKRKCEELNERLLMVEKGANSSMDGANAEDVYGARRNTDQGASTEGKKGMKLNEVVKRAVESGNTPADSSPLQIKTEFVDLASDSSDSPPSFATLPQPGNLDALVKQISINMLDGAIRTGRPTTGRRSQVGQSSAQPWIKTKQVQGSSVQEEEEVTSAPPGFNTNELVDLAKYKADFSKRKVNKMLYLDLTDLIKTLQLDLFAYFDPYMPWLSVNLPYSPRVVKHFYYNLEIVKRPEQEDEDEEDTESHEEEMKTSVRGQEVIISASRINEWLGIDDPPEYQEPELTDAQVFKILRPGVPIGTLKFTPAEMTDFYRILWYVYSRMIVNRSGNFTHFVSCDYKLFTSIVSRDKRNLGELLYLEIRRYHTTSRGSTRIPFPQIVSLILQANKIWYLDGADTVKRPTRFGRRHISNMGIHLPIPRTQPIYSMKRKRTPPPSEMPRAQPQTPLRGHDDTQSSTPIPPTPGPSQLTPSLQAFIRDTIQTEFAAMRAVQD